MIVDTSQQLDELTYIEASTENSQNVGILQLRLYVTNYAPFFTDGAPEIQQIQLSTSESAVF